MKTTLLVMLAALTATAPGGTVERMSADQTTEMARLLVLERIDIIARMGMCRQAFGRENIDIDRLRLTAKQTRFYSISGSEGELRFSEVTGKPASPDDTLRVMARDLPADAFVLGYQDGAHYVRTKRVVLNRGYFEQPDESGAGLRPTTLQEKQSLLLHELLHIALDKDDDALNARDLCPLRLLAFCPSVPAGNALRAGTQ